METNFDNQLLELDEFKQQYKVFNGNLEGQKIVDDGNVTYIVNHCRGYFQGYRRRILVYYPLTMVLVGLLLAMLKVSAVFVVMAAIVLLFGLMAELWIIQSLTDKSLGEISLAEFAQRTFDTERMFLIYNVALICSLFIILFSSIVTLDVPDSGIPTINAAILILCGLSVTAFLVRYLPVYRQCSKVVRGVEQDSTDFKDSSRSVKVFGLVIVAFVFMTAVFKLFHLPCGTLFMLFTGLLSIIFAIVLAVRLRKRHGTPVIVSLLLVVVMSMMTYLVMAWVNHWPPMRHLGKWEKEYIVRPQDDLSAAGAFALWEVAEIDEEERGMLQEVLRHDGVKEFAAAGSHAITSVAVGDTAKVNAIIQHLGTDSSWEMPVFIWTNIDTCLVLSPLIWTDADKAGRCQLYAMKGVPVLSDMGRRNPSLQSAGLEYFASEPVRLCLNLTPEANKQWQIAVFGFGQRDEQVNLAAILNGHVIAVSRVDNDYIGYQSIAFSLDSQASITPAILDELIKN